MRTIVSLALVAFALATVAVADKPAPRKIDGFKLPDPAGKVVSMADYADKKALVIVFLGTECPINNQYLPTLSAMADDYAKKGVAFLGVNSNVHDTTLRVEAHAKANKLPFAVVKDAANVVADKLGARRTPEAFVLIPKTGEVVYQGRIDDRIGVGFRRKDATKRDLADAVEAVLAGKAVATAMTDAPGCLIARAAKPAATGKVTFTKDVAKIIQSRCQECHRAGEVAPMPLVSYEDALSWRDMIAEVVGDGRMPPWGADPAHGKWANDRTLTKADRETLLAWIKDGCPKGDDADMPKAPERPKGWTIGKPDVVFEMPREFTVPADAGAKGVKYQYFMVPTNFDEDKWIEAAETKPGAREVVHHIIIYVAEKGKRGSPENRRDGIGNGFLTAYAPGDLPLKLEPGQAKKLPKGATLVFQMHYTPDGVERKDRSSVGIRFAKQAPKQEVKTRGVAQQLFRIPPGHANWEIQSQTTFTDEVELYGLLPHMHVRGKDFKYEVTYPDGKKETLLSVPKYDFNWQSAYRFETPKRLPAGTKMVCTAHFDNSKNNLNNPDPTKSVFWGDQTWEEMMIGFVDYGPVRKK